MTLKFLIDNLDDGLLALWQEWYRARLAVSTTIGLPGREKNHIRKNKKGINHDDILKTWLEIKLGDNIQTIDAYTPRCIHIYVRTYKHTYITTYVRTYITTHLHKIDIDIHTRTYKDIHI